MAKKIRVYFTMDEEICKKFEKHVEYNILDKSKLIEKLIINYLKENNK
jgi:metal-responsive CopG/Arc/MetJ family transcriptional regulator